MTLYSSSNANPPQRLKVSEAPPNEQNHPVTTPEPSVTIESPEAIETPSENLFDGELRSVEPTYARCELFSWLIFDACVLIPPTIAAPIILLNVSMHPLGAAGMALGVLLTWLILGFLTWKQPAWRVRSLKWAVNDNGIEIHHGIFWRHVVNVPRSRIQHTDVTQGPILRAYGLAILSIHTAGQQHNKVELPGITHDLALKLRDDLARDGAVDAV